MSNTNETQTTSELRAGGLMLESRRQEQGDKVNSEQEIIVPADGGLLIEALNQGHGNTSALDQTVADGAVMHESRRRQEEADKVNSDQTIVVPADARTRPTYANGIAGTQDRRQEQGDKLNSGERKK